MLQPVVKERLAPRARRSQANVMKAGGRMARRAVKRDSQNVQPDDDQEAHFEKGVEEAAEAGAGASTGQAEVGLEESDA